MVKQLNKNPKLFILLASFVAIGLISFAGTFNVVHGRQQQQQQQQQQTSKCNKCGECTNCLASIQNNWSRFLCVAFPQYCSSLTQCTAPAEQPPQPFVCTDVPVSYVERLSQYNINGLDASISSNGKYTVKGMTTHGSYSCDTILKAILDYNTPPPTSTSSWYQFLLNRPVQPSTPKYNVCAYPSSVSEERLERVNWSFNNMTAVKDCGNVKGVYAECNNGAVNFGAYPGFTTIGAIASPYQAFTDHSTILQNAAPNQYRWGGLYQYGIRSDNAKPGPYSFFSTFYNNSYETLKLAFNYEMVYSSYRRDAPCWSPFPFWRECHRVHYFTYTPRVQQPNITLNSYLINHRDRPSQLIYRNSPIRKSWQIENANAGSCNIETKNSSGEVIPFLSKSGLNIDFKQGKQIVDFLPINGATGQYLEKVDQNADYTISYDPSRLKPGDYTSTLTCSLSINCSSGSNTDDCKRSYPGNPYGSPISVSASKAFTIYPDQTVTLAASAKPTIVYNKFRKTKILANTKGANLNDTHKYKLAKIPKGYRLTSPEEIVKVADASGTTNAFWDVELVVDPKTNVSEAIIGASEFVVEMTDEPYDNLYTAKAKVIYLGNRDVREVAQ